MFTSVFRGEPLFFCHMGRESKARVLQSGNMAEDLLI